MRPLQPPAIDVAPTPVRLLESRVEHARPPDRVLADALTPGSAAFEQFRVLRTKIKALDERRAVRRVGVVSAGAGEGATSVALGLAVSLTRESDQRVLLIDAHLRRPGLGAALGIEAEHGLSEWLTEGGDASLIRLEPWGLSWLPGGAAVAEPAESLGSPRMGRLLDAARQRYDYVVVDCAPLARCADSVVLQDLLDGFVLVVRSRTTQREVVLQALSQIKTERILGVVYNGHRDLLTRLLRHGDRSRSRP